MSSWLWLIAAAGAAAGSYAVGWPAWRRAAERRRLDLNAERYLAWRGRADARRGDSGLTGRERQLLVLAAVLALAALFCLVGFITYV